MVELPSRSRPAPPSSRRRRWRYLLAWSLFILIGIASVIPGTIEFRTGAPPELEHVVAYALAGGVFALVYGRRGLAWSAAMLAVGATGFELAQFLVPERTPRLVDAAFSLAGATIGLGIGLVARRLLRLGENRD